MLEKMWCSFCYRPQRSMGKGIFFYRRLWFCPQGGCLLLGGCLVRGGTWSRDGVCSQGDAWSQGELVWGVCSWGVPGLEGSAPGGLVPGGCLVETPVPPPGTATAAGGTHPTGMHSCYQSFWLTESHLWTWIIELTENDYSIDQWLKFNY